MLFKKRISLLITILFVAVAGRAQYNCATLCVLARLDSIRQSPSVSQYFSSIYFDVVESAIPYLSKADTNVQCMMDRMEKRFADYFFRSAEAYQEKNAVSPEWETYYADTNAPTLRYILYGINAHINGDIWQALTTEFSLEEIRQLKPLYFSYNKKLLKSYDDIYESALDSSHTIKWLHTASFGFDRLYGKMMLGKWRKRQVELAELYFTNKSLFEKKLVKTRRKMDHLNKLIRKNI